MGCVQVRAAKEAKLAEHDAEHAQLRTQLDVETQHLHQVSGSVITDLNIYLGIHEYGRLGV